MTEVEWPPTELIRRQRRLRGDVEIQCPACGRKVEVTFILQPEPGWVFAAFRSHSRPKVGTVNEEEECSGSNHSTTYPMREEWWVPQREANEIH